MHLVVDTNILFSFFKENSLTKNILTKSNIKFFSPRFAITELKKYSDLIMKKSNLNEKEFNQLINKLNEYIIFENEENYNLFLKQAEKISPDRDDVHFLALSMKNNCSLWSNDKLLKSQDKVNVLSTEDIVDLVFG